MGAVATANGEEVLIPLATTREQVPPVTKFRSTWLASSLRALRARDLYGRYLELLPPDARDAIVGSVAGVWLPVEVANAHYEACDRLGLTRDVQLEIGRDVTVAVHGTVLSTFVKLATGLGTTPWTLLGQLDRLWFRVWEGGAVTVARLGPKEARIEIVKWPCARVPYCRNAMHGVIQGVIGLVCRRVYVHPIPGQQDEKSLAYRVQWA